MPTKPTSAPETPMPGDPTYWSAAAEDLTKRLPGERLITTERTAVIRTVEGFRGLLRPAMLKAHGARKEWKPGDLYIVPARGGVLINVHGRTTEDTPEVLWLKKFQEGGKDVSGTDILRSIAEKAGETGLDLKQLLSFAQENVVGQNVRDAKSPIRIIQNDDLPPADRETEFNKTAGTGENSVGVATLDGDLNGIETMEQARSIIRALAETEGVDVAALLDPRNIRRYTKKYKLLEQVMRFFTQ